MRGISGYWEILVDYPKPKFKHFIRDSAGCSSLSLSDILRLGCRLWKAHRGLDFGLELGRRLTTESTERLRRRIVGSHCKLREGGNAWDSLMFRIQVATTFIASQRRDTRPWTMRSRGVYLEAMPLEDGGPQNYGRVSGFVFERMAGRSILVYAIHTGPRDIPWQMDEHPHPARLQGGGDEGQRRRSRQEGEVSGGQGRIGH